MAAVLRRKVLEREDFGLCILLPKTAWQDAPEPGSACSALVNGDRRRLQVMSEDCDCRGIGLHEHRFLALPRSSGLTPGARCTIELG
jgi:hypothetical protein